MKDLIMNELNEAYDFVSEALSQTDQRKPNTGIVLGSGLSNFAHSFKEHRASITIPFEKIPHFSKSTVTGHTGELVYGLLPNDDPILILNGRVHFYEGAALDKVILPIRLLGLLGIKKVILTNASGAIRDDFIPGQLMAITDHLNLTGHSPLLGPNLSKLGPRFVDMSKAYDPHLINIAKNSASNFDIKMHEGIYAGLIGPCYETPAEIRMLKLFGADAVGMSTIFETIAARHMGISVLGISCLTNKAAGLSNNLITHEEVIENNAKVSDKLALILTDIAERISKP